MFLTKVEGGPEREKCFFMSEICAPLSPCTEISASCPFGFLAASFVHIVLVRGQSLYEIEKLVNIAL